VKYWQALRTAGYRVGFVRCVALKLVSQAHLVDIHLAIAIQLLSVGHLLVFVIVLISVYRTVLYRLAVHL